MHTPMRYLSRGSRGRLRRGAVEAEITTRLIAVFSLPGVDLNHQDLINSQACCRYITGDRCQHRNTDTARF